MIVVKFPMTENIWNTVVPFAPGDEDFTVQEECADYFLISYHDELSWNRALTRFEGMIEHEVLPSSLHDLG